MSRVLNQSRARGTTKLVLLGIANHDGDGGSWPTIATLARYANTSPRAVQRAINQLVLMGELKVEQNAGGTQHTPNDRRPNRYRITLDKPVDNPVDDTDNGVTGMSPRSDDGVTPMTRRGDTHGPNGVTPVSPEPSLNHQEPAAAAAATLGQGVDELRFAFARRAELEAIAFTMSADQRLILADLVRKHGVDRLVRTALATNSGRVRRVTAFFGTWQDLVTAAEQRRAERDSLLRHIRSCPECGLPMDMCREMNRKLAPDDRCPQGHTPVLPDEVAH